MMSSVKCPVLSYLGCTAAEMRENKAVLPTLPQLAESCSDQAPVLKEHRLLLVLRKLTFYQRKLEKKSPVNQMLYQTFPQRGVSACPGAAMPAQMGQRVKALYQADKTFMCLRNMWRVFKVLF